MTSTRAGLGAAGLAAMGLAVLTGCGGPAHINGARTGPLRTALASSQPTPAPASTTAQLNGSCAIGWTNWNANQGEYSQRFTQVPRTVAGQAPQAAYQLTLTNTSSVSAALGNWVVVFDNSAGKEITSANGGPNEEPTYILPGQTLMFTEDGDTVQIPAGTATCQFLQWGL